MRNYLFILIVLVLSSATCFSQCFEERHSTNWFDGWVSCAEAPNPNPIHGNSHWIMYDLKGLFKIEQSWFWNCNDVNNLNNSIREAQVDFSVDGTNWTTGPILTLSQASGLPTYEGEAGPDFAGIDARYILITGIQNYGGDCMALSEVRFEAQPKNVETSIVENVTGCASLDIFPNPAKSATRVYINSTCKGEMSYAIYDLAGRRLVNTDVQDVNVQEGQIDLSVDNLTSGEYIFELTIGEDVARKKLVVID